MYMWGKKHPSTLQLGVYMGKRNTIREGTDFSIVTTDVWDQTTVHLQLRLLSREVTPANARHVLCACEFATYI
jgi:hypothetical protein